MKIKREKSTSTKGHYVRNAELLPAVIAAKAAGKVSDELIRMIWMIAERYSRKSNFIGYSFREDMVSAAVMNLCNNALKFNPEKSSNPFSFYTTAIHNSFLQFMADEKKHRNIRDALLIDAGSNPSFNYQGVQGMQERLRREGDSSESTEPVTSDEIEIKGHDTVEHDELGPNPNLHKEEVKPPRARHPKWAAREPGPVIRYRPDQIIQDPVTGKVTIKEDPPVVALPVVKLEEKNTNEPRQTKKKIKKAPAKKSAKKKTRKPYPKMAGWTPKRK